MMVYNPAATPLSSATSPPAPLPPAPERPEPGYPDRDSLYAEVDGILVHHKLLRAADPAAPLAVCLHGFGASLFSFELCASALRSVLTLVPFDTPGFGFTSRPARLAQYTRRTSAVITGALANAYAPTDPYVLLAHSMGGSTAARVILPDPARLAAVVLVAPALMTRASGARPPRREGRNKVTQLLQRVVRFITERITALSVLLIGLFTPLLVLLLRYAVSKRSFWENGIAFAWPRETPPNPAIIDGYRRPIYARTWEKGVLQFTRAVVKETLVPPEETQLVRQLAMLGTLAPPVLIVHGDGDKIIPVSNSRRLAEQLPTATLVEIPGAGHTPHEEQPELFTEIVRNYLSEIGVVSG